MKSVSHLTLIVHFLVQNGCSGLNLSLLHLGCLDGSVSVRYKYDRVVSCRVAVFVMVTSDISGGCRLTPTMKRCLAPHARSCRAEPQFTVVKVL